MSRKTLKGNRPGTHFTKEGWKNIGESLYKKAGLRYDKKQIKNHWDATKEQWKIWCELISSDMKWDPETNTFGASEEDWTEYIHAHPEAAQFRFKELQHLDKLEIIYDFTSSVHMETSHQRERQNDSSTTSLLHTKDPGTADLYDKNKRLESTATVQSKYGRKITEEVSKGNRPRTHFTKEGWGNIVHSFHVKTGLRFDRMQLKNHWDVTKEQWKVWCKLVGTANPEAAQFRFEEFQLADKLGIMFDGITNTGETEPPVQLKMLNDGSTDSLLHKEEPIIAKPMQMIKPLSDVIESSSALTVQSTRGKLQYSIGECIECLDGMEEIEQGSDLYLFALDIFLKKEYREIFLQLQAPRVRIAWLQRLQNATLPLHIV
ncbi:hypothetical protein GH714_036742 [Hevea brasiliensis]|uniref:Myb/SANT-like domain-containing protein n=1 Tax=Hevea brasiliensis TaxID=3981 RepID=A0A6A6L4A0_HEVBR|nr:hypothetical protein GH714_036742 [Hevea brasiliensis]